MKGFCVTLGLGIAVGALGALMLPRDCQVYKLTKDAAESIKSGAEKAIDQMGTSM